MFVLFCACDVMNVLSVKKNENLQKKFKKKEKKKLYRGDQILLMKETGVPGENH